MTNPEPVVSDQPPADPPPPPWPVRVRVTVAPSVALGEQAVTTVVTDRDTGEAVLVHARSLPDPAPDSSAAHEAAAVTSALATHPLRGVTLLVCSHCRWAGTTNGEEAEGDPVTYADPEPGELANVALALEHRGHEAEAEAVLAVAAEPPVEVDAPDPSVPVVVAETVGDHVTSVSLLPDPEPQTWPAPAGGLDALTGDLR